MKKQMQGDQGVPNGDLEDENSIIEELKQFDQPAFQNNMTDILECIASSDLNRQKEDFEAREKIAIMKIENETIKTKTHIKQL